VAVVLLSIFTLATGVVVAQSTAASANNRARISASGLAQRELEFVRDSITADKAGAETLLNAGTVVNPHVSAALESGDTDFAYEVDGQRFRIERYVARQSIGKGSPCESLTADASRQYATLVKVTVTWEGMGASTRPHVASLLVPPHSDAGSVTGTDNAVIGVKVSGVSVPGSPTRSGIRVKATGPSGTLPELLTDPQGCAVFVVSIPSTAPMANYEITLLGHISGSQFVTMGQETEPVQTVHNLSAGESRQVKFESYEEAASLRVHVPGADPVGVTEVFAQSFTGGSGAAIPAPLEGGTAKFDVLCPGEWGVWTETVTATGVETSTPVPVTLEPGTSKEITLP
jgi:hypothetical protein